jgi:hypothetical protein
MGATSVRTDTSGIDFQDGTEQLTAAVSPTPQVASLQAGVVVCTGTSSTVIFAKPYVGLQAPVVVVTGLNNSYESSLFYSVSIAGTNGNWTGFTLNLSASLFGAFGWMAIGNPS